MRVWLGPALAGVFLLAMGQADSALAASVRVDDVTGNAGNEVTVGLFLSGVSATAPPVQQFFFQITLDFAPSRLTLISSALPPEGETTAVDIADDTGFISSALNNTGESPMVEVNGVTGESFAFDNSKLVDLTFQLLEDGPIGVGASLTAMNVSDLGTSTTAVIPLPPAVWLLLGALTSISFFRRHRGR